MLWNFRIKLKNVHIPHHLLKPGLSAMNIVLRISKIRQRVFSPLISRGFTSVGSAHTAGSWSAVVLRQAQQLEPSCNQGCRVKSLHAIAISENNKNRQEISPTKPIQVLISPHLHQRQILQVCHLVRKSTRAPTCATARKRTRALQ